MVRDAQVGYDLNLVTFGRVVAEGDCGSLIDESGSIVPVDELVANCAAERYFWIESYNNQTSVEYAGMDRLH